MRILKITKPFIILLILSLISGSYAWAYYQLTRPGVPKGPDWIARACREEAEQRLRSYFDGFKFSEIRERIISDTRSYMVNCRKNPAVVSCQGRANEELQRHPIEGLSSDAAAAKDTIRKKRRELVFVCVKAEMARQD